MSSCFLPGRAYLPVPAPKVLRAGAPALGSIRAAMYQAQRVALCKVRQRAAARRGEGSVPERDGSRLDLIQLVDESGVPMTSINKRPTARQVIDSVVRQARLDQLSIRGPGAAREKDRTVLLSQPAVPTRIDYARQRLDRAVLDSFTVLVPLQTLALPMMIEGVDEPPGTPDAEGDINTFLLSPGGVDWQADLWQNPDNDPGGMPADRWWTHTWVDTAAFPAAPESGRLYFQFTVDLFFRCITPTAAIRGVYAFITLQSEAFLQISMPMQVPQFTALAQSTQTDLTGSIPVAAGQQLNLDLTYGMLLFAGNGEFASQGSFATHRTVPEPSTADFGVIEYRFIPDWWITSVSQVTGLVNK
jgi:hypothetical protein